MLFRSLYFALGFLLLHLPVHAELFSFFQNETPFPPNPCESKNFCSDKQVGLMDKFQRASGLLTEELNHRVYAGTCFHRSRNFDGRKAHFGVVYFSPFSDFEDSFWNETIHFSGRFQFFGSKNPYLDWTPEKAREEFSEHFQANHKVLQTPDYSYVRFDDNADPIWRYWLRQNHENHNIYLVSYWSIHHFLICELQPL